MATYLWEENRTHIYDSLHTVPKIVPRSEHCLLHGNELKNNYQQLETTLKGNVLPWDQNLEQTMAEDVCCCSPTKKIILANYGNMPKEIKHWRTYENITNKLNSDSSVFPDQAKNPLQQIMQLHLQQKMPHYEIFLNMLLGYIEKPHKECFKVKVKSLEELDKAFGPGEFLVRMQEKKYNAKICQLYEDHMLYVIIAARCSRDFRKIKSYMINRIESYTFEDDLSQSTKIQRNLRKGNSMKKSIKYQYRYLSSINQMKPAIHIKYQSIWSPKKPSQTSLNLKSINHYQKKYTLPYVRHKRCGILKCKKQDVSYIANLQVKDPAQKQNIEGLKTQNKTLSPEEYEMLHIMMDEDTHEIETDIGTRDKEEAGQKLHELFTTFKFHQTQMPGSRLKHSVEFRPNTQGPDVNKVDSLSEKCHKVLSGENQRLKTEIIINCGALADKQVVTKYSTHIFDYRGSFNTVWLMLFVFFTLLGVCVTCIVT